MKGCVISLVILVLIAGAVAWNAVYVGRVTESLLTQLATLPDEPNPDETPAAISAIHQDFEQHLTILHITVSHVALDRVSESLKILETQARIADRHSYAATLTLLRELVREIGRLEKLSAENIF